MMTTRPSASIQETDLIAFAAKSAISAIKQTDSSFYRAAVCVSLMLIVEQGTIRQAHGSFKDPRSRTSFRSFLKNYAYSGGVVWIGTDEVISKIQSIEDSKDRKKAASNYIDKRERGSRLIDFLGRIRTISLKIVKDIITNHVHIIEDIMKLKSSSLSLEEQVDLFHGFISETYGHSSSKLQAYFAPDSGHDPETLFARTARMMLKLNDPDLSEIIRLAQEEVARRIQVAGEFNIAA